ncbi:hypothetical protein HQ487_02775 [Candidatus Uhrbacteria bacterium]|nr:hypothetical protein [Candidatus Uhrbacteria bacterium]
MMRVILGSVVLSMVFMGAGCSFVPVSTVSNDDGNGESDAFVQEQVGAIEQNKNEDEEADLEVSYDCVSGMESYFDESVGLQFCYPSDMTVEKDQEEYFIKAADGTLLRDLAVYNYDTKTLSEFLATEFVNQDAEALGYTCEVENYSWTSNEYGTLFTILGFPTGNADGQGYESVNVCRDSSRYQTALTKLVPELFFEPGIKNGLFLVINGEQDAAFGDYTDAFMNSIRFR